MSTIRVGDRVTIRNRFGQEKTGRAVMPSSAGGWVLNMGGAHGTPGIATEENTVKVRARSARKNPPIFTGGKRKLYKGAAHLIGMSVYEIRYRHAADGKDYKHAFETDDVIMLGMPDGSLRIESNSGKRLWENFDV